ncbi:hypothetical protein NBRGN_067_00380 [Nocardia brasiliensis NBRC 14402]|uniref:Rv0361 family membrane protein n=1 Tax=Nocardia brasiliensis TaxID=37326 RepID=UPI00045C4F95|nr:hypothetical protein [Nocardia brasiliensis]ASF09113.2 hypothetical protein CEQ30_19000 [Nocardia brasiliensis]GAJ83949.1 hypothetical protein NBRGN_067_00380 [Nocardia brasiliensis NBRC 14402]SUB40259.1 Uncharacterised protein [Nocardia brasiliensis]
MTDLYKQKRIFTPWLVLAAVIALVVAITVMLLLRDTSPNDASDEAGQGSKVPGAAQVEQSVKSAADLYNANDFEALGRVTCGELAGRLYVGDNKGLLVDSQNAQIRVKSISDFHFTTVEGGSSYTFARVVVGVDGDPAGDSSQVAFFSLLRNGTEWKLCTAQLVSSTGI